MSGVWPVLRKQMGKGGHSNRPRGFIASGHEEHNEVLAYSSSLRRQARSAEAVEHVLKKLCNLREVASLDVAAVQHVQGLAVTEKSH